MLFLGHLIGCFVFYISTQYQPEHVLGMFRPYEWWGCERPLAVNDYRFVLKAAEGHGWNFTEWTPTNELGESLVG